MNANFEAILMKPDPRGHIVYPYTDETQLFEAVALFAGSGLEKGESALLCMEQAHFEPTRAALREAGLDVESLEAADRLTMVNADALLSVCVFDGIIDELEFKTKISALIESMKDASLTQQVRVFGEMVNVLWMPHPKATHRLETLWNDLIEEHQVPLLCAYKLGGMRPEELPDSLLDCHSTVMRPAA